MTKCAFCDEKAEFLYGTPAKDLCRRHFTEVKQAVRATIDKVIADFDARKKHEEKYKDG